MGTQKALILAGRGRYGDPWHDHASSSVALAGIVQELGIDPTVKSTFYDQIPDFDEYDLLIVNASRGNRAPEVDGTDEDWVPFHEKLNEYAASGKPILAFHTAVSTFEDSPTWAHVVGGRWIRGTTHHPKMGQSEYVAIPDSHPIVAGLDKLHAVDERYTYLFLEYGVQPFLKQWEYDRWHASAWVNQKNGYRVVYHALGHTAASINSADHHDLLIRELKWLLKQD